MPPRNDYRGLERRSDGDAADPEVLDEIRPGERFGAVLERFLDAVERKPGITLLHHKPAGPLRVRKLWIDAAIKERFDQVLATVPVSAEMFLREAIYRFTSKC